MNECVFWPQQFRHSEPLEQWKTPSLHVTSANSICVTNTCLKVKVKAMIRS